MEQTAVLSVEWFEAAEIHIKLTEAVWISLKMRLLFVDSSV